VAAILSLSKEAAVLLCRRFSGFGHMRLTTAAGLDMMPAAGLSIGGGQNSLVGGG